MLKLLSPLSQKVRREYVLWDDIFGSYRVDTIYNFFPVFRSIEQRMIKIYIPIPWFFEKDASDAIFCKFMSIFHRIIDHKWYPEFLAYSWFWKGIRRKVIYKVDDGIIEKRKMRSYPTSRPFYFPRFFIASSSDNSDFFPKFINLSYSFECIWHRGYRFRSQSRFSISFPYFSYFFRSDIIPESWGIMFFDLLDWFYMKKFSLILCIA